MKKLLLITLLSIFGINSNVKAQWVTCGATTGTLSGTTNALALNQNTTAPSYITNPTLLNKGFLIVLHDTMSVDTVNNVIIKGSDNGIETPQSLNLNEGDTFSIVSFSYNIHQIRKFVQGMLYNSVAFLGSCCSIAASQENNNFCPELNAVGIMDSSNVNTMEDVLNVISIFTYGSRVYNSMSGFNNSLENLNAKIIATYDLLGCSNGVGELCYAFDSLSTNHDNYIVSSIPKLVITEIMYNGPEGGIDETEFIEIYNNGSTAVDLTNYTCTGGNYTFPSVSLLAGEYYVIAVNSVTFNNVFGFNPDGEFSGGLNNSGEPIVLKNSFGNVVDSVFYYDVVPWPIAADGNGPSLILCDVNSDNNDGNNWGVSNVFVGSFVVGMGNLSDYYASPGVANICCANTSATVNIDVCYGGSYNYADGTVSNNIVVDESHVSSIPILGGCDSVLTENITVLADIDNTINNTAPMLTANQVGATYRWLDCDNGNAVIPSETSQSFTATSNGNYAVEITVGSCVDTSACENISAVGMNKKANTVVSIYPNPTNGTVNIKLSNNTTVVNYSITTIEGRVIENGKTTTNNMVVDLSKEGNGVYFIKINTENSSTVYKLIKQ